MHEMTELRTQFYDKGNEAVSLVSGWSRFVTVQT
jgi:hypothetical protein